MTTRSLGHRAPLLWLALPLMAGIAAGKTGTLAPVGWLLGGAAVLAAAGIYAAWRAPRWWALPLSVALFLTGNASYGLHRARLPAWDALPPREVRVVLRVDRVFTQTDPKKISGLATVVRADSPVDEIPGQRLYFSLALRRGEIAPVRSALVSASGVMVTLPRNPPSDTFDGYLAGAGMNFRLTRGRILREEKPPSAYRRFCARMAQRFSEILGAGVIGKRPELVAVFRAMMLGQQGELSAEQDQLFMQSGTMHMFSISGLHIAVIAAGLQALLALVRLPRIARFATGLAALWLYVDITGTAPSAVRAFLMVAALQSCFLLRVPGNPLAALSASAVAVLLVDPMQLFSASFQMSYGIVAALILLGLPLADAWSERGKLFVLLPKPAWRWHHHATERAWRQLLPAAAIGVAATLVSAVSGVLFFQLFTPGALLANLAMIPAASLVIIAGFVSLLCGLTGCEAWTALFNHAAILLLAVIEALVRGFVKVPGMWFAARFAAPWIGTLWFVLLLAALLFGYAQHWRKKRGGFWPPFVVVVLALIFGVKFG
ncbi:MAG TPA: ComEC/Rec2 family competence protein [Opitutaceae bacterium]|nr:ComEC/Rec2 family competence protein [Opitutaceae bacterium]